MDKLRNIFLLAIIFAIAGFCQGFKQTVKGRVIDADSKTPLIGATVAITNIIPSMGTRTDNDGNYKIDKVPVGRYTIKVTYVGYKAFTKTEVQVNSGKEVEINVELKESVVSSKELVVTAKLEKDKPVNSMAMISARSFSVDESRRYAGSMDDPMRAVSSFAGVAASSNTNTNGIVVRGNSPKGLLWKLEDVDIPNPNHFSYVGQSGGGVTVFSSQVLANSDFYTAAFPAEYGNAASGVFDMKFRNGNTSKYEYTTQIGIQGIDLSAEGPFSKDYNGSFLFNYRYSVFGFLQLIDPSMKNKVPSYQDLSFKINLPTESFGTFSIFGIGGIARSKYDPDKDSTSWKTYEDFTKSRLDNNMGAFAISNNYIVGKNTFIKSTFAGTYNSVDWQSGYMDTKYNVSPTDDAIYKQSKLTFSSYINHKFNAVHTNKTGFIINKYYFDANIKSLNQFNGKYEQFVKDNGNTSSIQAYSQSKLDFTDNFSVNSGVHFLYLLLNDKYSIDPRFSLKWSFTEKQALSFGYGHHSQLEEISIYLAKQNGLQPNKDLGLSKANHFVIGYDNQIAEDMRIKIEGYYQNLYDVPVMKNSYYSMINNPGGYFNDSLVNKGKGRNIGIDITFEKFLSDNYYYLFTASLFDSKYKGGDGIERNSRFNCNYVFNALIGKEYNVGNSNILGINFKASYTGGEYYIPIDLSQSIKENREVLNYNSIYNKQLKDFLYLDLTLTYRTNYDGFSGIFALQIKNVLNDTPVIAYTYNRNSKKIEEAKSMGIIPTISYKLEF